MIGDWLPWRLSRSLGWEVFLSTCTCLKRTLTTSFGSVCLGALVTSVLTTLELATIFLLPCCIVDLLLRYLNRYAFVQVATYGKSYFNSARSIQSLFKLFGAEAVVNDNLLVAILLSLCPLVTLIATIVTFVAGDVWLDVCISPSVSIYKLLILTSVLLRSSSLTSSFLHSWYLALSTPPCVQPASRCWIQLSSLFLCALWNHLADSKTLSQSYSS